VVYTNPNTLGEIGIPVHLAVGYELMMDLVIFAFLMWLARAVVRRNRGWQWNWQPRYPRDGTLFWTYLTLYSLGRFFIEFYRLDTPFFQGISQAQLLAVLAGMVGVWGLVYQFTRARRGGSVSRTRAVPADAASVGVQREDTPGPGREASRAHEASGS
jgi:phosphatidylglycerol:prolipoprotein diacylglycerol transferase